MFRKVAIALVLIAAIAGGTWYYFNRIRPVRIENLINNPGSYVGKDVTIEGEVTDKTAFFGATKFFKVKDGGAEIIVVTRKKLPELKSGVTVKGRINQSFPLGDQNLLIFTEDSFQEKTLKK